MEYQNYQPQDQKEIYELFCDFQKEECFYKDLTFDEFANRLFNNPEFQGNGSFVARKNGKLVGFASALVRKADDNNPKASGYIHTFIVKKEERRKGIGSHLLALCEQYIKDQGKTSSRFVFLGQINWPWYIPHTDKHLHPGAPAVRINSEMYIFLYHHGYFVNSIHEGFHLPLSQYELPESAARKMKENEAKGLKIEIYDPKIHYGIEEFCDKINNPGFAASIRGNLKRENPKPFLVASDHGKVVGWTGAIYTESTGRGHLDGICVDPDVRGGGLGKGLFCTLCYESKKNNATYMTFFTGLDNPARYIYLHAGFQIAQSFADMKKELE